jgi:hypothetical protein
MHDAVLSFDLMRTLVERCPWRFLAEHIVGAIAVRDLVCWIGEAKTELRFFLGIYVRKEKIDADLSKLQRWSYVGHMALHIFFQCSDINGLPHGTRHALSLFLKNNDYQLNTCA